MNNLEWIKCPVCGNKTRLKMRCDTKLYNFPLYCPKCRKESLISVEKFKTVLVKETKNQRTRRDRDSLKEDNDKCWNEFTKKFTKGKDGRKPQ